MKPVALALASLSLLALHPGVVRAGKTTTPAPATERYALGLLYRGSQWTPERTPRTDSIQAGHMANIRAMWSAGKLVAAGPCAGDPQLRGIFVWKVDSLAELPELLQGDPAIQSGRLRAELHHWYAEPGIGAEYRARKQADPAARDSMVTFSLVLLQRGPAYTSNWTKQVQRVLRDHAKHAEKLRAEGLLVLGGSIEGLGDPRGMLVFAADTARTRELLAADPAVKSGRFVPFIWQWWTALGNVPGH
jgi:uncharacterized protein YciI